MDVSPRALRAVTFREKLRGYHQDDVDQFLERVAEGIAALQGKLDDALARAERAERESSEASEGEEAVRRTLTLAQRTADLAIKEARDEATRLVDDARDAAERIADEAQRDLRADLERLEAARRHLQDDVLAMQQYVENERIRVRNALAELVRKVDSTTKKPVAPPEPTKLDVPPPVARRVVADAPAPKREPQAAPAPAPAPAPIPEPEPEPMPAPEPVRADAPEPAEPEPAEPSVEAPRIRREPQPPPVAGARFAQARPAGPPSGPPPGPRRMAASLEPVDSLHDDEADPTNEVASVRRLFGR